MHVSAALALPEDRLLPMCIELPNRFQVAEVNIAGTIDDDATGRMRLRSGREEYP